MQVGVSKWVAKLHYFRDGSTRYTVHQDPISIDLDGDGVDEILFGGLETQPNTPAEFSPINLHVLGWSDGALRDVTSAWLPAGANEMFGVGQFTFGDFNGDGKVDVFCAAYADMEHAFTPFYLLNQGSSLKKFELPITTAWQHGAASGDLNNDGFDDVLAIGYGNSANKVYLGSSEGLLQAEITNWSGGSGATFGRFLNDQDIQVVEVDHWQVDADSVLGKLTVAEGQNQVSFEQISVLPVPRIEDPVSPEEESHDVRIVPFDFNFDGLDDVVIFSRAWWDGSKWPDESAVQFLRNDGSGVFTDVTDSVLVGYDTQTMIPYHPLPPRDFNRDGLIDLFLDGATFNTPRHKSATLLLAASNGLFVDTGRNELSSGISNRGGVSTLAMGPDGNYHQIILNMDGAGGADIYERSVTFPERELAETLRGTPIGDSIWGLGGNDVIVGLAGADWIDGGTGLDIAQWDKPFSSYSITREGLGWQVSDIEVSDDSDFLIHVERIHFSDQRRAIDLDGNAGTAAKILGALWGKESVENPAFVGIVLHYLDSGVSYEALLDLALGVILGANKTNEAIVELVFTNLVGEAPTQEVKTELASYIDSGAHSQAGFARAAADLELNAANIDLVGLTSTGLQYTEYVA